MSDVRSRAASRARAKGASEPAAFYSRRLGGQVLVTNDWGHSVTLAPKAFEKFRSGRLGPSDAGWDELREKGFLQNYLDFGGLAAAYRRRHGFLWGGPSLHIFVITLRCNHGCLYCQSSAVGSKRKETDMSLETARASVEMVFSGPNRNLNIEFQGGEPMLNWPVVEAVVRLARKRNETEGRNLTISLVTNMSLMDDEKLEFLLDHEVSLCTSLDGPPHVHDRNRPFRGGSSQALVMRWLKEIERRRRVEAPPKRRIFKPSALMTASRFSLPHGRGIVDACVEAGLDHVFLRPLSPIGYAKRVWDKIGYSAEEYLEFYRRTLDYIIELNLKGLPMMERMAAMLAFKVLKGRDPNFLDCRSPCGAAIGQLAYNYDGDVYVCDEGRMVAQGGDKIFRAGNVLGDSYNQIVSSKAARACCAASLLESQPACSRCAYKPFCGVCPVYNYEAQKSLWGLLPRNAHCEVFKGLFDELFGTILKDRAKAAVIESWLDKSGRGG